MPVDITFNKQARQSSTLYPRDKRYGAAGAIGKKNTDVDTCFGGRYSITKPEKNPWWRLYLGGHFNVKLITITLKNQGRKTV